LVYRAFDVWIVNNHTKEHSLKAEFSPCGKYRYSLQRNISLTKHTANPVLIIMLNPSIADAEQDDPTIKRCMQFAERDGFTRLTVVNLFALVSTDPEDLYGVKDPIGPKNNQVLAREIRKHDTVIAAWGAHPFGRNRGAEILLKIGDLHCFGLTKDGCPRHPLYVKGDTPLQSMSTRRKAG
jgi:hypothetical protein